MSRQDRLHADLDRGFEALELGNLEEAEACLARCNRIDRKSADVITLAAALADARGDADEALAKYAALAELQPDNPMPRICMARIQLRDVGDPDAALDTLDAAFDFIDEEADLIEAIVVRAEALITIEDFENARAALGELSTSMIEDPELALDLGELALAAEDARLAQRWAEVAQKHAEYRADALHLLGRVHEATGDRAAMVEAWQQVRTLDGERPARVTISEDELERIASEALAELPETARTKLEHVPILIDDVPSPELVADGLDPRTLGVIDGPTLTEPDAIGAPTHIRLFKKNLEAIANDLDQLAEEVRITVLHETAHYFGLEEEDLEKLGLD